MSQTSPQPGPAASATRESMRVLFARVGEKCDLPPLPAVALRAMQLARDPDVSVDALARVVSTDAPIAARVLRISRSAIYVRQKPPGTLREAITTIGFEGLRRVLIAASARSAYRSNDKVADALWQHALATALAADELSAASGEPRGGPGFIAGLLHDIGRLVMHLSDPKAYAQLGHDDAAHEEEVFGVAHASIGGCLAEQWNLDDAVVEAIMFHHRTGLSPLADRIGYADRVAHAIGLGSTTGAVPTDDDPVATEALGARVLEALTAERSLFD